MDLQVLTEGDKMIFGIVLQARRVLNVGMSRLN